MNNEQMERTVREVMTAAVEQGDLSLMARHPGLAEVMPIFKAAIAGFSERGARFPLQFSDGEQWVATRMVETGRHTGDFMGAAPTGNEFELEILMFHRFEDGLIVGQHSQADAAALMRALGLAPGA